MLGTSYAEAFKGTAKTPINLANIQADLTYRWAHLLHVIHWCNLVAAYSVLSELSSSTTFKPLKRQSRLQQTTFINIFFQCVSEKIRLNVSSESYARQRIHMTNQAIFSSKDKRINPKMSSAAIFVWRF